MLGGFGVFNVGRNNPRIRDALVEALQLDTPGSVQLGVSTLPGLLAEELLSRAPASIGRVLFTSSGAESVEAAIKPGRAATGRSRVVSAAHGFHGPTGACLLRREVHEAGFDSMEHSFSHGSTFAPNDLGMAAGLATLRELDAERLVERSARLGEFLLDLTRPLVERYEVVGEVRGLGLMWAIEFGEPESRRRSWRLLERTQPGLFAQLVVVPLFSEHAILS